jgi:hypothetical protein
MPRDVETLTAGEFTAMCDYASKVIRAEQRQLRKRGR